MNANSMTMIIVKDVRMLVSIVQRHAGIWPLKIILKVKEKQSLDVDVVSGSTVTSKAYLKAMEDALKDK